MTANLPMAQWLPLLVLYNTIFVLPPVLLLLVWSIVEYIARFVIRPD
jgi:hypothetical protein